jgi:CBS domain-containing protein
MSMTQQNHPEQNPRTVSGRGAGRLIEKGWTVYDALEHPLGTVHDVDTTRDILEIDGRPVGFETFDVPMEYVGQSGGNEVHLNKVIESTTPGPGGAPILVEAQAATGTASTTRTRGRTRTATTTEATPSAAIGAGATTTTRPVGAADASPTQSFGQFSPPYASTQRDVGYGTEAPDWGDDHSGGWNAKKLGMAALAMGGLAAAGYVMRRRTRRRSRYERFLGATTGYLGTASGLASDYGPQKYPTWWASLAATALPLAYYAWPSATPTYREQAQASAEGMAGWLEEYVGALTDKLPFGGTDHSLTGKVRRRMPAMPAMSFMDDFELPDHWWTPSAWNRSSGWSMPGDWAMKSDVALPLALVAASAVAIYMARRRPTMQREEARIRDVMTRKPRVIQPDATVADAATLMRRLNVGALPVCDGSRLIGMVTDRDITTRATAEGRDPYLTAVRDVMSPGVAWALEDDPVEEAARIMREHQIRRLPIVDDRHSLVGVVSLGDLATEVADDELSGDTLERISK